MPNDKPNTSNQNETNGWEFPESNAETYEITPDDYDKINVNSLEELENHDRPLSPELKQAIQREKRTKKLFKLLGLLALLIILYFAYIHLI